MITDWYTVGALYASRQVPHHCTKRNVTPIKGHCTNFILSTIQLRQLLLREVLWSACLYVCMHVRLSVRSHISKTKCPNFTKFSVRVDCGRGSDHIWWQCTTLCTSGFVDDNMFSHVQCSELFIVTSQVAPLNCASGCDVVYPRLSSICWRDSTNTNTNTMDYINDFFNVRPKADE